MSRQRNAVKAQEIKLSLPMDLSARVDLLLWDPVLQKPKYGKRSEIITQLLTQWCNEQEGTVEAAEATPETESISL